MKKKYLAILGVTFLIVYLGGMVVNQQVKIARFNNAYESYEKGYSDIINKITSDSFYTVLSDEKISNDIEELNQILIVMERYETDDVLFEYLAAYEYINNLSEGAKYLEKWNDLSNEERNTIINGILMDKSTFSLSTKIK